MSLLNITNLTDRPKEWIEDKFMDAFEEVEKDFEDVNAHATDDEKKAFIDDQINNLEEYMEEAQGKDLLGIIDNYLVNLDYYAEVKEWYENKDN